MQHLQDPLRLRGLPLPPSAPYRGHLPLKGGEDLKAVAAGRDARDARQSLPASPPGPEQGAGNPGAGGCRHRRCRGGGERDKG